MNLASVQMLPTDVTRYKLSADVGVAWMVQKFFSGPWETPIAKSPFGTAGEKDHSQEKNNGSRR